MQGHSPPTTTLTKSKNFHSSSDVSLGLFIWMPQGQDKKNRNLQIEAPSYPFDSVDLLSSSYPPFLLIFISLYIPLPSSHCPFMCLALPFCLVYVVFLCIGLCILFFNVPPTDVYAFSFSCLFSTLFCSYTIGYMVFEAHTIGAVYCWKLGLGFWTISRNTLLWVSSVGQIAAY